MFRLKSFIILSALFISFSAISQKTVAILPFTFTDDGHLSVEKDKEAQQYLIQYILKKQKHVAVTPMNACDVNVKLNKAGITPQTIDNFTTKEISDVLGGVDFILIGSVDRSMEGAPSMNTGFGSVDQNSPTKTNVYGGSVTSTIKNIRQRYM